MKNYHSEKIAKHLVSALEKMRREDGWEIEFPEGNVQRWDSRRATFGDIPRAIVTIQNGRFRQAGHAFERTLNVRIAIWPEKPHKDDPTSTDEAVNIAGEEVLRAIRRAFDPTSTEGEGIQAVLEDGETSYPVELDESDVWDVATVDLVISYAEDYHDPSNVIS